MNGYGRSLLGSGQYVKSSSTWHISGRPAMEYRPGMLASETGSRTGKQAVLLESEYILVGLKATFISMLRVA
jgi:hypothetical protein